MEQRYTVTQTAEILGVRASVLRYWEEELELRICRNEQGHRYYTGNDITLLANIKELKKRGLALRAIKELIPRISRTAPGTTASKVKLLEDEQPESEKRGCCSTGKKKQEDQKKTFVKVIHKENSFVSAVNRDEAVLKS